MPEVVDDRALLDEMMKDIGTADPLFQPTNYWAFYEKRFLPELAQQGLRRFRSRRGSVLSSFGATDLQPRACLALRPSFRGASRIGRLLSGFLERSRLFDLSMTEISPDCITPLLYNYVKAKFERTNLRLESCPTSAAGDPEDRYEVDGAIWSSAHLLYCSMVADAASRVSFSSDSVICEVGSGMGRNIEVLAKLHPGATLLMFDIPPQLYVANQYLGSVFGDRLIPYREAKKLDPDDPAVRERIKGKILALPTWRIPAWSRFKIDIFWNSASFQEMEPTVVKNYLQLVKSMRPQWVYINALPQGNWWGTWRPGRGGVKEAVTERCYMDSLEGEYLLKCSYATDYFFRPRNYRSYVFERRA